MSSRLSEPPSYLLLALLAIPTSVVGQSTQLNPGRSAENSAQSKKENSQPRPANPLIARIGKEELRLHDFIREVNQLIPLNFYHKQIPQDRLAEFRQKAFDSLALKRRIYLDALDRKLPLEEQAIRNKLTKALKRAGGRYTNLSKKQFEEELEKNRPLIRRILLIDKNNARFEKSIPEVTDEGLRKVYSGRLKEDPKAFQSPRESHLLHIFVKMDPSRAEKGVKSKEAWMAEAKKELDKGVPFSQVARLYSEGDMAKQGGDLGWVKQGTMRSKTLDDAAFKLKAGQMSGIIQSLYGLHIVKCVEVKPTRTLRFEEVKKVLKLWLTNEHKKISKQRWTAELTKKYPMEILAPDLIIPPKIRKAALEAKNKKKGAQPSSRPASSQPAPSQPRKD